MIFASTKEACFGFRDQQERLSICAEERGWVRIFASRENKDIAVCFESTVELVQDLRTNYFDPALGYHWEMEATAAGEAVAVQLGLWEPLGRRVIP